MAGVPSQFNISCDEPSGLDRRAEALHNPLVCLSSGKGHLCRLGVRHHAVYKHEDSPYECQG